MSPNWKVLGSIAVASAALVLVGCGQSICARSEEVNDSLETKEGGCEISTSERPTREQCEDSVSECTAEDEDKLNEYFDCLENVPTCVKDQELAWLGALAACGSRLEGISANCGEGFND